MFARALRRRALRVEFRFQNQPWLPATHRAEGSHAAFDVSSLRRQRARFDLYLGGLLLLTGLASACDGSGKAGKATPADASSNHGDGDCGDGDGDGPGDGDSGDGDSGDGDSGTGGDGDLDASPGDGDGDTELTDAGSTLDSGLDSGSSSDDAGTSEPDAGDTPGNDDRGQVTCTTLQGSEACDFESEVCCIAQGCVSEATGCENGPELTFDGPEDCANGDVCCAARSGVSCADSCENGSLETCHDSEDCAEIRSAGPSSWAPSECV